MLSHPGWIPEKIMNHPVAAWFISSGTLVFLSVSVTWMVLNATTLG